MHPEFTPLQTDCLPDLSVPLFPAILVNGVEPLARMAAEHLQVRLDEICRKNQPPDSVSTIKAGKMFGILVVSKNDTVGYLAAFSGKWKGSWNVDGFVPPPFSVDEATDLLSAGDQELHRFDSRMDSLLNSPEYLALLEQKGNLILEFNKAAAKLKETHRLQKQQRALQRQISTSETTLNLLSRQSQNDKRQRKLLRRHHQRELDKIEGQLAAINQKVGTIQSQKLRFCRDLQVQYFSLFRLFAANNRKVSLLDESQGVLAASGSGECAAPKLLSFAFQHGYKPLAGAEFWWGPSPSGEIRHHATYYPPCRSKCAALLPRMLSAGPSLVEASVVDSNVASQKAVAQSSNRQLYPQQIQHATGVKVIYEDSAMAVVDKPAGLLSVPGKGPGTSLADWARHQWPDASGPLLVHRLDMDTSGLVLLALESSVHKQLQKQFIQRKVNKSYVAIIDGWVSLTHSDTEGMIALPLRVDLDDRPRQMVCEQHGRLAETRWRVLDETHMAGQAVTRMLLQPVTGRTHQLRIHMASQLGLGMPISGDPLYAPIVSDREGSHHAMPDRMMLHAETLEFVHPLTRKSLQVTSDAPF